MHIVALTLLVEVYKEINVIVLLVLELLYLTLKTL